MITDFIGHPAKYATKKLTSQKNDKEKPLISIIMPVYNGGKYLGQALGNIAAQEYPSTEIIIVDDGSTDNTPELVEKINGDIRYFRQPNAGPGVARNRGIRNASGEFIAFLDVDDLWPEHDLEILLDELLQHPELDLVRGYAQLFTITGDGKTEYIGNPKESFPDYIGAALYRKSAFSKVGLYDPELRFGEDGDWFNRAKEANLSMKRLGEITLLVQRHENNMTKGKNLVELNALKVFKKKLERKRAGTQQQPEENPKIMIADLPVISVIVPVYNSGAFITEALQSIHHQNYSPLEIIVVDDGSTDNTAEMVKLTDFEVKYIRQENRGPAVAKNTGIKNATGKYIAFLDADDLWTKDKLIQQLNILRDQPKMCAAIGHTLKIPVTENPEDALNDPNQKQIFMLSTGATLFRKSAFDNVGSFDENLKTGEDTDWFLRARENAMYIAIHREVVQLFRIHRRNLTNNPQLVNVNLLRMHRKLMDQRTKAGKSTTLKLPNLNDVEEIMKFWQSEN